MSATNIALLFLGWAVYWLSMAKLAAKQNGYDPRTYAEQNFYDMSLSFINCILIVITHDQLSFEIVDMTQPASVIMAGFMSSVIINQAIQHFSKTT